jgi:four helix bundle protein
MTSEKRDIEQRTFQFAVRIVRLVNAIPRTTAGHVMARQLVRSGTSVGANAEEAKGDQSKKDFALRMNIARSEAREVLYWLRLLPDTETVRNERLLNLTKEADELARILTTIVKRAGGE